MLIYQRMPGLNLVRIHLYYGNAFDYNFITVISN